MLTLEIMNDVPVRRSSDRFILNRTCIFKFTTISVAIDICFYSLHASYCSYRDIIYNGISNGK